MIQRLMGILVLGLPILLVFLAVSASGFLLLSGGPSLSLEARLLRGWCGVLVLLLAVDLILLVTLLGWITWSRGEAGEAEMRFGDRDS